MEFDSDSIEQIGDVRIALESQAAKLAAARATPEQLAAIETILRSSERAIQTGAITTLLEHTDQAMQTGAIYPPELDFHHAVIAAAQNMRLASVTGEITTQFRLARARGGREESWAAAAHAEHVAIFEAIRDGDGAGAAAAMELHVSKSTRDLIAHAQQHRQT